MGSRGSCNQRIAKVQDTPALPCICPKSRSPLCFFASDRKDAIRIPFHEIRQHGLQTFAPLAFGQEAQAELQFVQHDGRNPQFRVPRQKFDNLRFRCIPCQFRNHIGVQKKSVHVLSWLANGISRPGSLRSGISRCIPRGTLSISHWPSGFSGLVWASHTSAGITTKDFLIPMRWGPSASDNRRILERCALASLTVQDFWEWECATIVASCIIRFDIVYIGLYKIYWSHVPMLHFFRRSPSQ